MQKVQMRRKSRSENSQRAWTQGALSSTTASSAPMRTRSVCQLQKRSAAPSNIAGVLISEKTTRPRDYKTTGLHDWETGLPDHVTTGLQDLRMKVRKSCGHVVLWSCSHVVW